MAQRLTVVNRLRAKIKSQGVVDLETMAERIATNTTYNKQEMISILRLFVEGANIALQNGETVKLDGLLNLSPQMKVGGTVKLSIRANRGAVNALQNPSLWPAAKVVNHGNMTKTADALVALWNAEHPDDLVDG